LRIIHKFKYKMKSLLLSIFLSLAAAQSDLLDATQMTN
jgi:hypothetical protein